MPFRMTTVGNALVIGGGVVGVATVAIIATGTEITLTPAMIQLLIYKGLAAASIGLIVAGSWVGRRGRQQEQDVKPADPTKAELAPGASVPYNYESNAKSPAHDNAKLPDSN